MKTYARLVEGELDVLTYVPNVSNPTAAMVEAYAYENGYKELVRRDRPGTYYSQGWHETAKRITETWTPWELDDARSAALKSVQAGLDAAVDARRTIACEGFDSGIVYDRNALINAMGIEPGDTFIDAADGLHTLTAESVSAIRAALKGARGLLYVEATRRRKAVAAAGDVDAVEAAAGGSWIS